MRPHKTELSKAKVLSKRVRFAKEMDALGALAMGAAAAVVRSRYAAFLAGLGVGLVPVLVLAAFPRRLWGCDAIMDAVLQCVEDHKFRRDIRKRPKRIILVRHGESEGNIDPEIYAHVPDSKIRLTDMGKLQAREAGKALRDIMGDESCMFYVSPFLRTRETYAEISKAFEASSCKMIEDPRVREQECGNFQFTEQWREYRDQRYVVGRFFFRFPEGESGCDVYDRCSIFLETLFRQFESKECHENIVLVTHGLFMRLFLMRYYRWSVEEFDCLENFRNGEFVVLEKDANTGKYVLMTQIRRGPPPQVASASASSHVHAPAPQNRTNPTVARVVADNGAHLKWQPSFT